MFYKKMFHRLLLKMSMTSPSQQGSSSSQSTKPLCRYFASNICYKGDACEFSHEKNARPDMTCRYYLAGNCSYGSRCRYDHVRPPQENSNKGAKQGSSKGKEICSSSSQSQTIVAAPKQNPWKINPLGNFHQNMAQELELLSNEGTQSAMPNGGEKGFANIPLCPYFEMGFCPEGDFCKFVHGLMCDMCGLNALHPQNQEQRLVHHRECLAEHEKQMEAAFAEARSAEKQCGICMEVIVEKGLRFGILQNCTHCYCLECIRKWRSHDDEHIQTKTVRSCPECRVHSNYVIPSKVWIDDKADKEKLILHFKDNTKKIPCKYVVNGEVDKCPFGNKCFYKHQLPDGTIVEGKSPSELRQNRHHKVNLYDFLFDLWDSDDDEFGLSF